MSRCAMPFPRAPLLAVSQARLTPVVRTVRLEREAAVARAFADTAPFG